MQVMPNTAALAAPSAAAMSATTAANGKGCGAKVETGLADALLILAVVAAAVAAGVALAYGAAKWADR